MEEICDLRQPVLFDSEEESIKISSSINCQILLETYPTFEVKIRDNRMTEQEILQEIQNNFKDYKKKSNIEKFMQLENKINPEDLFLNK